MFFLSCVNVVRAGITLSIVKQSPNGNAQLAGIASEHCREVMKIDVYNAFVYGVYGMLLDRYLDKFEYLEYAIPLGAYQLQTRHRILCQDNDEILLLGNSAARLMTKSSATSETRISTDDGTALQNRVSSMQAHQGSQHVKFAAGMKRRRAQQLMQKIDQFTIKCAQLHMWYAKLLAYFEELKIERKHKKAIAHPMKKAKEAQKKVHKAKSKTKLVAIGRRCGSDDSVGSPGKFQTQLGMQTVSTSQQNTQQPLGSGALKRQNAIALLRHQSAKLEQMYSTIPDNLISAKLKTFMKSAFEIISDSPEKRFTRALQVRLYPTHSIFYSNYRLCLITEGRYEAAIEHFNYTSKFKV